MAIKKTISRRLQFRFFLTTLVTVSVSFAGEVSHDPSFFSAVISTLFLSLQRDAHGTVSKNYLYKRGHLGLQKSQNLLSPFAILHFPFRFYHVIIKMGDNLRRAVQDLNLGDEDEPIALPADVVAQAAAENRFMLIGRPVMPRRQNIQAIVASMPRNWGQSGIVHGRIVGGNHFQFIFPSEESLENVLRRGPWAFNERMLIMQRWNPQLLYLISYHSGFRFGAFRSNT